MAGTGAQRLEDTRRRHHHLLDLHTALRKRDVTAMLKQPLDAPWSIDVGEHTLLVAGADGVYAYVTESGHILAPAESDGIERVLDFLTRTAIGPGGRA
jgi:hypothetical protein